MAKTFLATTDIRHDGEVVASRGDTVTKSKFDTDEQWDALVEAGAVIEDDTREAFNLKLKLAADAGFTGDEPEAQRTEMQKAADAGDEATGGVGAKSGEGSPTQDATDKDKK